MTSNPLAQTVDIILTALKTFDKPFLTKNIKITNPSVGIGGDENVVQLTFNTDLQISEFNKISHVQHHHITIPKNKCNIPNITSMIMGVILDSALVVANDIAFGKEGIAPENTNSGEDDGGFVWVPDDVRLTHSVTLATACELFNKRAGGCIENYVRDSTIQIKKASLGHGLYSKYGYPLFVEWSRAGGFGDSVIDRMYVTFDCLTDPHKLITTVLVVSANNVFKRSVSGEERFDPFDKFITTIRDAVQIYNNTIAINVSASERVLFDKYHIYVNNTNPLSFSLKMSQKGSDDITRKIKLDKLEKYTTDNILNNILVPLAQYAQDPIMFKQLANERDVCEHRPLD